MDITLKLPAKTEERYYLKLTYYQKAKDKLTQVGHEMGFDQFALSEEKEKSRLLKIRENRLTLNGNAGSFLPWQRIPSLRNSGKKKGISLNWSATGKPLSQRLWNGMFTGLPRTMTEIL